nr:siderophore-interacting protein [uncultured Pseudomonas sp.]
MTGDKKRFKYDIEVVGVRDVTPSIRRITFRAGMFGDISSCKPAEWFKLFVPSASGTVTRAYTVRGHCPQMATVDVDFVLHGEGAAGGWAQQATVGQWIGCSALRGGFQPVSDAEWLFLVADETGTPAVMTILEAMNAGEHALVFLVAENESEWQPVTSAATVDCRWVYRNGGTGADFALLDAISEVRHPPGMGQFWIASEAGMAQQVREYFTGVCSIARRMVRSKGYWMRGVSDHRE